MDENVKNNLNLVNDLMQKATGNKALDLQQGNKKLISVEIKYDTDSGEHYEGTLFFRRPSAMDYMRMGAIKSELLRAFGVQPIIMTVPNGVGGFMVHESMAHVDSSVTYLARAISTCDVLLTEPIPPWFINHRNIEDTDMLVEIYALFDQALTSFRKGSQRGPSGDSETGAHQADVADSQAIRERDPERTGGNTSSDGPTSP